MSSLSLLCQTVFQTVVQRPLALEALEFKNAHS